jgi:DNA-binding CsgD family transcriptional regulator
MNWRSVCVHLADRAGECVLVDRTLTVRLLSLGLERRLGWPRDEVEGRSLVEALVLPEHRVVATSRLARAFEGTLPVFEMLVVGRDGGALVLAIETAVLGSGNTSGLLLDVTSMRTVTEASRAPDDEIVYEIDASDARFGALVELHRAHATSWTTGDTCYQVLYGRDQPCQDCPMRQPVACPWPRETARTLSGPVDTFEIVSATPKGEHVRVRIRRIAASVLSMLQEAKLKTLTKAANLSERESQVLHYLLMGRSLADIALIMGITLRTVKFHQANIVEKLGIDSRADLVRLFV